MTEHKYDQRNTAYPLRKLSYFKHRDKKLSLIWGTEISITNEAFQLHVKLRQEKKEYTERVRQQGREK